MIAYADNRTVLVGDDGYRIYFSDSTTGVGYVTPSVVAVPPFHCPPWEPFEEALRDTRTKAQRRLDELFAWTRKALRFRCHEARRFRFADPSQRGAEFRVRGRACGSSWRVTLR